MLNSVYSFFMGRNRNWELHGMRFLESLPIPESKNLKYKKCGNIRIGDYAGGGVLNIYVSNENISCAISGFKDRKDSVIKFYNCPPVREAIPNGLFSSVVAKERGDLKIEVETKEYKNGDLLLVSRCTKDYSEIVSLVEQLKRKGSYSLVLLNI